MKKDAGYSLIEMLVVLGIVSVIGSIFTTAVLQIYRTASAIEAESTVQAQLSNALLQLDKTIRYSYSISAVHTENSMPYVEYLVLAIAPGGTAPVKRCVQLRLTGSDPQSLQLQSRSWTVASSISPSAWTPLASNLITPTSGAVFARTQPTTALNHQMLGIRLSAKAGTSNRTSAVTYTALNTYASTALDAAGQPFPPAAEPCYHASARS
ncbi:type II secretion system GspH family protein [Actinoplanes sp. TRM 88003]|uniref:Type II secretion system GspH family protein n=1 Tax=Paractinoplanes aksuensis TaxID=2939490 RepID=A0ABT1DT02_9ACTN|nr:type II secretion system protein [Actinoplanes aksuensis]MCO8273978.1 type II secretion system GspH family protein [Actinoplanes aksuensis]